MSLKPCLVVTVALALANVSSDVFAQRGGRGGTRGGAAAQDEVTQSASARGRGRRGGVAVPAETEPPAAGRGRRPGTETGGQQGAAAGGRLTGGATTSLFAALDANDDGVITRAEMEDAIRAFTRLDENKDGRLSKEEAGVTGGGGRGMGRFSGSSEGTPAGGRGRGRAGTSGPVSGRSDRGRDEVPEGEPSAANRKTEARSERPAVDSSGKTSVTSTSGNPFLDDR